MAILELGIPMTFRRHQPHPLLLMSYGRMKDKEKQLERSVQTELRKVLLEVARAVDGGTTTKRSQLPLHALPTRWLPARSGRLLIARTGR